MKPLARTWAPLGLLMFGVRQTLGHKQAAHQTTYEEVTVPVTKYREVPVTRPHYVDVTHYVTVVHTRTATASTTTTLCYTVSTTKTDIKVITNTKTDVKVITDTKTDIKVVTNTKTDLKTITNTKTETSTTTVLATKADPCPQSCSISAATVNLYFWPTNRPHTYPTTYVHPTLGYTFTSPSVYIYVPTAAGTKSGGVRAGPATASWMIPQRLDEVSTIDAAGVTRPLTLADLRTDCPQTADPTAIATMRDSACDPVLAAPRTVSTWAFPCNACGRFGLFDPPYAVPTLPGGLVPTSAPPPPPPPPPVTSVLPVPTTTPPPPPPAVTTTRAAPSTVATAAAEKTAAGMAWLMPAVVAGVVLF